MANASVSGASNGASTSKEAATNRFDPTFTQHVIDTMGPKTTDRNRIVMGSLIRHIHDFAREVELTIDEWQAGVQFVNAVGQIYTKTRNEAHRVSDILGLESFVEHPAPTLFFLTVLVDEIAHKMVTSGKLDPTSSSILGPFWSPNAPFRALGDSILQDPVPAGGRVAKMHGVIRCNITGEPIPGAVFDIWQASANGKYDFQDPDNQTPNNLRGKFIADDKGHYSLYCLHPTAYSLPTDGPSYQLLNLMDRHPMRPAHLHIMVTHPGFLGCTTQLYPKDDPWLESDTVFAVKNDLVVDFTPLEGDGKAILELVYDVSLVPKSCKDSK